MERNRNAHTYFNSRPHKEVDQSDVQKKLENQVFQLTISQGDRHQLLSETSRSAIISTHDLTKRSTWSQSKTTICIDISTHDLARRSTLAIVRDEQVCQYFNSRPRKEVDILTERMPSGSYISTHDLTRRSTGSHVCTGATPAFQLTTSRGGRHYPPQYNRKYVQVFQLTTSQGGRPCRMIQRQAF